MVLVGTRGGVQDPNDRLTRRSNNRSDNLKSEGSVEPPSPRPIRMFSRVCLFFIIGGSMSTNTVLSLLTSIRPGEGTYDQPADLSVLLDHYSIKDWPDCDRSCSGEDRISRALDSFGFRCSWSTGERDSFGPLSRILRVIHLDLTLNENGPKALYFFYA